MNNFALWCFAQYCDENDERVYVTLIETPPPLSHQQYRIYPSQIEVFDSWYYNGGL